MKSKKNIEFIFVALIVSFVVSMLVEVFYFNRNVITTNKKYTPKIIEMDGIIKQDEKYVTEGDSSYITIDLEDNYINKIRFNYKTNNDIYWYAEYLNDGKKVSIGNASTYFLSKSIRRINANADTITLKFTNSNVEISDIEVDNKIFISWVRVFIIMSTLFTIVVLYKYRKYFGKRLDKAFVLVGLIAGLSFILGTSKTVFNAWDDEIHMKNSQVFVDTAYGEYSEGFQLVSSHLLATNGTITNQEEKIELYKVINKLDRETNDMRIQLNSYGPKYGKIIYLPYKIGFVISDLLNLNLITAIVVSKMLNLLFYLLIIAFAIKISDDGVKKLIFIIGLLVSNMFLATQFSYDSTINAALILAISLFLRMLNDERINYKYMMAFILSVVWASLPKAIYCFFGLLVLFIPNSKFKSKKQAISVKISVLAVVIVLMSSFVLPVLAGGVAGDSRGGNTSVSLQLKQILNNPFNYMIVFIKYYLKNGISVIIGKGTLAGLGYIGDGMEIINFIIYLVSLIYILCITFTGYISKKRISKGIKSVLGVLLIGMYILIPTALYLSFTEVGSSTIEGVQPRYFICLLLPLLLILTPRKKRKKIENGYLPIISFSIIMFTVICLQKFTIGI